MTKLISGFAFISLLSLASCLQYQIIYSWTASPTCSTTSTGFAVTPTETCTSPYDTCSNINPDTLSFDAKTECVASDPLSPTSVSADFAIYKFWASSDICEGPYTIGYAVMPTKCILGGVLDAAYKLSACSAGSVTFTKYVYMDYCIDEDTNMLQFTAESGVCQANGGTSRIVYCPGDIIPPMALVAPVAPPTAPVAPEPVASEPVADAPNGAAPVAESPQTPTSGNVPQSSTPQKTPVAKTSDVTRVAVEAVMFVVALSALL